MGLESTIISRQKYDEVVNDDDFEFVQGLATDKSGRYVGVTTSTEATQQALDKARETAKSGSGRGVVIYQRKK